MHTSTSATTAATSSATTGTTTAITAESTPRRPRRRRVMAAAAGLAALVVGANALPADAAASGVSRPAPSPIEVLQTGLNSPKGLDSFLGIPVISQGAFGPPGPVVSWLPNWWGGSSLQNLTPAISLVDVAVGPDLSVWGLGSDRLLYRKTLLNRNFVKVADIPAYQVTDPDPTNTEGDPTESNPYGLAVLPNGNALVTDAANNDLLRITPRGQITTVARFGIELISTDHLPADPSAPLPPALPTEAVPTSVALAADGSVLVGELKGFPFRPGSSRIWKVDPKASGATCAVAPPTAAPAAAAAANRPACVEFASGFTAVQDIAVDPHSKKVFVYQLAAGGVLAFEGGLQTGQTPPAVLTEVAPNGQRRELAAGLLVQPGGIEITALGQLLATDGVFGDGRLVKVRT